jgi:LacI family transcriptional regulator
VTSGIGDQLIQAGYFYFTAHHRHQQKLVEEYTRMFIGRGAQGIIAVDTSLEHSLPIPIVAIAGHRQIDGVTNVSLNHARAAELTLTHLHSLGHRKIAFMRGQPFSSDSEDRWSELAAAAVRLGIAIDPDLVVCLDRDLSSPELGYPVVHQLMATGKPFTAIVAFNDLCAVGSIRALADLNLRVPNDISVIGFDDIAAAAYTQPRLTTIRQPLAEIGRIATRRLLDLIHETDSLETNIVIEPELIVRQSTGPVPQR